MPRLLRIEYPGAIYHVMSRGDQGDPIYLDDGDRHDFLKTLAEACEKTGFVIHAYCLMKNHFHLVVETPEGNLVSGMRWLLSTYSNRFNHRHNHRGHLFSGRYKAQVVDGRRDGYLRTVCDYTHLNPARARLLPAGSRLLEYPWSSYSGYLTDPRHRPKWLRVAILLGEHGIARDSEAGRRKFERRMEARRTEEGDTEQWKGMRRGWCLGGESFKRKLLEGLRGKLRPSHSGKLRRQISAARAETIVAQELKRLRWKESDLKRRAKSDPGKLAMAAHLQRETTLTIEQIAKRLQMGSRKSAAPKLHQWRKANE